MLANCADEQATTMTQEAIRTLQETTWNHKLVPVVVETNERNLEAHKHADYLVVFPNEPFNYNRFLNKGLEVLDGWDCEYTALVNNDLLFEHQWFDKILAAMVEHKLDSACPYAPGWPPHESMPSRDTRVGSMVAHEFCGWCVVIKTEVLKKILPLDESFAFEWQDVDMIEQLRRKHEGWRHGLIFGSRVKHLLNQSHRFLETRQGMIEGAREIFERKYNP
jgi:GT2 family glycosyltransferase